MITAFLYLTLHLKPVALVPTEAPTCGASERLLKEPVKVFLNTREGEAKVNDKDWVLVANVDGVVVLAYRAQDDAYMSTELTIDDGKAWYTIRGINKDRQVCVDTVYMKRVR